MEEKMKNLARCGILMWTCFLHCNTQQTFLTADSVVSNGAITLTPDSGTNLYGNNVSKSTIMSNGGQITFINTISPLPGGILKRYFVYAGPVNATYVTRLQIWRPQADNNHFLTLIWEQLVRHDKNLSLPVGALYNYSIADTVVVEQNDVMGLTAENSTSPINCASTSGPSNNLLLSVPIVNNSPVYPQMNASYGFVNFISCSPAMAVEIDSCFYTWSSYQQTISTNGINFLGLPTLPICQTYCVNTPQCVAIDWDGSCWVHMNSADLDNIYISSTGTQYRIARNCSITGCQTWAEFDRTSSIYGRQDFSYATLAGCQSGCVLMPQCVAVDWDGTCWFHTNISDLTHENTFPSTTSTQYQLSRECFVDDCADWVNLTNTNSVHGIHNLKLTTLTACQDFCVNDVDCVAIDWDGTCWLHAESQDLIPANTYSTANITQYRLLSRTCSSTTQPTVSQAGTPSMVASSFQPTTPSNSGRQTPNNLATTTGNPLSNSVNIALIVGLCVGLGVPLLICVIVAIFFCAKNKSKIPPENDNTEPGTVEVNEMQYHPMSFNELKASFDNGELNSYVDRRESTYSGIDEERENQRNSTLTDEHNEPTVNGDSQQAYINYGHDDS